MRFRQSHWKKLVRGAIKYLNIFAIESSSLTCKVIHDKIVLIGLICVGLHLYIHCRKTLGEYFDIQMEVKNCYISTFWLNFLIQYRICANRFAFLKVRLCRYK